MTPTAPMTTDSHPVLRSSVLTLIVVPLAVHLAVRRMLALYAHRCTKR